MVIRVGQAGRNQKMVKSHPWIRRIINASLADLLTACFGQRPKGKPLEASSGTWRRIHSSRFLEFVRPFFITIYAGDTEVDVLLSKLAKDSTKHQLITYTPHRLAGREQRCPVRET